MSTSTEDKKIPVPDITFKGTDGNECEAFVVAIRDFAFATGRDGDHSWMLRFATTRLRGKALRWHASLDPSITNDWGFFVQALFNQYPSVEEDGVADVATPVWSATTFSPGPSTVALPPNPESDPNLTGHVSVPLTRQYDASSTGRQVGLLRILGMEGTAVPHYVWWGSESAISTTINRNTAPVVGFLPSSVPHAIGSISRGPKTLALSWADPKVEYYAVSGIYDYNVIKSTKDTYGFVAKAWNLLGDGTLQATISCYGWKEEAKFTTTEVHVNTTGDDIRFVKPGTPLEQDKSGSSPIHPFVRARIVFEPL